MTQSVSPTLHSRAIPTPVAPSGLLSNMSKKVSETLITAQRKTATESENILPILMQFRSVYQDDYQAAEIHLPTSNGTTINGLHFPGSQKKALIYLHGNGYFCETAADKPLTWREGLKVSIDGVHHYPHLVVCNTGGTGKSEGSTHPVTVARELLAQFEYLVREHAIHPNDIAIAGYSMGGYLSTFGAELIQQTFPEAEINFLSERSFASIYSRAGWMMQPLILLTGWARDPIAAIETLKGRVCIVYHRADGVILYDNSTHSALVKTIRSRTYACLELHDDGDQGPSSRAHNRELRDEENNKIIAEFKRMLKIPLTAEEALLSLESI